MFAYLTTASLLLLVFSLTFYGFLRQRPALAQRRRVLWFGMLATVLLPLCPAPSFPSLTGTGQSVTAALEEYVKPAPQPAAEVLSLIYQAPLVPYVIHRETKDRTLFPYSSLHLLYGVVTFLFLLRLVWGFLRLRRITTGAEATHDPRVRLLPSTGEAFTFWRTVYVSQTVYDSYDATVILAHERAHARQLHTLDALFAEVFRAVFWFHPLAWWTREQVQLNLEYLADAAVLQAGYDRKDYQLSLVAHQQGTDLRTSLLPQFAAKGLKKRILMMRFRAGSRVRGLVATAGVVGLAFLTFAMTRGTGPVTLSAEDTTGPIVPEDVREINLYLQRLPTPAEQTVLRQYLRPFNNRQVYVFQECTEEEGRLTFSIGEKGKIEHHQRHQWWRNEIIKNPIRFQIKKAGPFQLATTTFRPAPTPDPTQTAEVLIDLDGEWIDVVEVASTVAPAKPSGTKPLFAELNCQLGLTPANKSDYNVIRATTELNQDRPALRVKSLENTLARFEITDLEKVFFVKGSSVSASSFYEALRLPGANKVHIYTRTGGPADLALLSLE